MKLRHALSLITAVCCSIVTAVALPADYFATTSKLSDGKWVKIKIEQSGIHQITYDQLREWGFSDPTKVAVYGYGGVELAANTFSATTPDDVQQVGSLHTNDGRILFYGEGDLRINFTNIDRIRFQRNTYSLGGYYLLSDIEAPAEMQRYGYRSQSLYPHTANHISLMYREEDVQNPAKGGSWFFGPNIDRSTGLSISFPLTDFSEDGAEISQGTSTFNGYFYYDFKALSTANTLLTPVWPEFVYSENTSRAAALSTPATSYNKYSRGYGFARFGADEDMSEYPTFDVTLKTPNSAALNFAALDYCYLYYPRHNRMPEDSPVLDMYFPYGRTTKNFVISNANATTQVWNVTNPLRVTRHEGSFNPGDGTLVATFDATYSTTAGAGHFVALDIARQHTPVEFAGEVANQNLHALSTPNMVIITTASLMDKAEELADMHRKAQGMEVVVVDHQTIFNEFSSGTPSAHAYRRFLKMLYDRNPTRLQHLLLYGSGSWDNRGIVVPLTEQLLTYQAETLDWARNSSTNFTSDMYFGMLGDTFSPDYIYQTPSNLSVGRMPVTNAAQATSMNNKVRRYFERPVDPQYYNRLLFAADDGDRMQHFNQSLQVDSLMRRLNPNMASATAHLLSYKRGENESKTAREVMTRLLNNGYGYFNYTGHANETSFTAEALWNKSLVEETKYNQPPFAMLSTCDTYGFDRGTNPIGQAMVMTEDGGMMALVGASRTVYLLLNQYINLAMGTQYATAQPGDTFGQVFMRAFNSVNNSSVSTETGINTLCYNLCGDPALPLSIPNYDAYVTQIDQTVIENDIDEDDENAPVVEVLPLVPVTIKGVVSRSGADVPAAFNGDINLLLYDGVQRAKTIPFVTNDIEREYHLVTGVLASTATTVVNGRFEATLSVPAAAVKDVKNHLYMYGVSNNGRDMTAGHFDRIVVGDYDDSKVDHEAQAASHPVIEQMYIGDESFCDGDVVTIPSQLHIVVRESQSGLNFSQGTIGSSARLILDDHTSMPEIGGDVNPHANGTATFDVPLTKLVNGRHSLRFSIGDNYGNRVSRTISFIVDKAPAIGILEVEDTTYQDSEDDNAPIINEATFSLDHQLTGTPVARLIIEGPDGRTVHSVQAVTLPYTWDLTTTDGTKALPGTYSAFVVFSTESESGSSPRTTFTIVR